MSTKQKIVLLAAIGIIVIMGLFPPWYYRAVFREDQRLAFEFDGGYQFLFPPEERIVFSAGYHYDPPRERPCINFSRLLLQWVIISFYAAGLFVLFKR